MPNMGMKRYRARSAASEEKSSGLADALFSRTQQKVLGLLFGQSDRSFYANELIQLAGAGSGAVQREVARLVQTGLVTARAIGNQKHYQANPDSPLFDELRGIIVKTVAVAEPLRDALRLLASNILAAFVYGSVAKREDTAVSDIDLMLISDSLTYADVFSALEKASAQLVRPINPTLLSSKELARRTKGDNAFVKRVLSQPKIWLIGREDDLRTGKARGTRQAAENGAV
jgi:predicted nucleotidyltransferase